MDETAARRLQAAEMLAAQRQDEDVSPIAVAGLGGEDVILVGHSLTGPWFQFLSRAEALALVADIAAAIT